MQLVFFLIELIAVQYLLWQCIFFLYSLCKIWSLSLDIFVIYLDGILV